MTDSVDNSERASGNRPTSRGRAIVVCLTGACLFLAAVFVGREFRAHRPTPARVPATPADSAPLDRGEFVFQMHCAKCHGPEGHGDAEAVARQKPPPRDFAARPWRFEVSGESIRRVTLDGIPATAMPAHRAALAAEDIDAVAAHVLRLATRPPVAARDISPRELAVKEAGFEPETWPSLAPDLRVSDAAGRTRTLTDERGRVVLINFWGITCEHCLKAMPQVQDLAEHWESKGLTVWNVCADVENAQEAQGLVERVSPTSRIWIDDTGLAASQFDVHVLPTIWIIDGKGRMVASARGMQNWKSAGVDALIRLLLAELDSAP